jgi:hypothetical protein
MSDGALGDESVARLQARGEQAAAAKVRKRARGGGGGMGMADARLGVRDHGGQGGWPLAGGRTGELAGRSALAGGGRRGDGLLSLHCNLMILLILELH